MVLQLGVRARPRLPAPQSVPAPLPNDIGLYLFWRQTVKALTYILVTRREIMFLTSVSKILTCMKSYSQQTFPCLLRVILLTVLLTSAPDQVSGHVDALAALPLVAWMEIRAGLDAAWKRIVV